MNTPELIEKIKKTIKYYILNSSIEFLENNNYFLAKLDNFELFLIYEKNNEEELDFKKEYYILGNFKIYQLSNPQELMNKIVFIKLSLFDEEYANLFEIPINIEAIRYFDHWKDSIDLFKKDYNFVLKDKYNSFTIHLDTIDFKTLFADSE